MSIRHCLLTGLCFVGLGLSVNTLAATSPQASASTPASTAPAQDDFKPLEAPIPLSVYQVHKNLGAKNLYIFDCNPEQIYERSHIPGAVSINREDWESLLPKDKKNSFLLFYCINKLCGISREVADRVLKMGYYNVYLMPDGINGWTGHGFEFEGTGRVDAALKQSQLNPYGKDGQTKSPVMPELNPMNKAQ